MFVLAELTVVEPAPASAQTTQPLSAGCHAVNDPARDAFLASDFVGPLQFFAGEEITATATEPTEFGPTTTLILAVDGTTVDTDGFPGTVSYIFPATTTATVSWDVDQGNVTWALSCRGGQTPPPPVTESADLSLAKTCDPGPVAPGAVVNCSVTVANAGRSTAQNVSVSDDLPSGVSLVGTPSGGGFTCGTGDPFTCTLPSLPANASATFTFSAGVSGNATPGSSLTNSATVSSTTPDPAPGPNTATATTTVASCGITSAGDIIGTGGNDVICGSAGPDRIAGLGGNDVIFGLGGDDQLNGGDGNDTLLGDEGSDRLVGGNGDDRLTGGGGGVDRLSGDLGDDTLNTVDGSADDYAVGGEHVAGDTCVVDPADSIALCER
jgi:uncharacterized repeat protein (TIGR01451 family)